MIMSKVRSLSQFLAIKMIVTKILINMKAENKLLRFIELAVSILN